MEKIFVFDLGNVIVKPMNVKKLYETLECKVSFENFYEYFKSDKFSDDIHIGLISTEEYIKKILKFSKSDKNIEEFISIFTGPIRNGLFKNTVDLIDRLKKENKKVCMLSNLRQIDFEWFSTQYDISKFDNLYLSYKMHLMKPDDEIYREMIKDLGVSSNSIYFFDDNQANVETAQKLGINAYCVTGDTIKDLILREKLLK